MILNTVFVKLFCLLFASQNIFNFDLKFIVGHVQCNTNLNMFFEFL